MRYITSDPHFSHHNICGPDGFVPCRTHFVDAEEMNETIIENWNAVVNPHDTVYILGDIGMNVKDGPLHALLSRLNGIFFIVKGNHDNSRLFKYLMHNNITVKHNDKTYDKFNLIPMGTIVKANKKQYFLTHYPLGLGEQRKKMRNLCGHIHDEAARESNVLNVGMDSPEIGDRPFGQPIPLEEAMDLVDAKWAAWHKTHGFAQRMK